MVLKTEALTGVRVQIPRPPGIMYDQAHLGRKGDGPVDQTLVLDVGWQPQARIPWERAVTLLWERKVETVVAYPGRELRSMSWTIEMPAVIRFLREVRSRKHKVKFSRENLLLRDRFTCQYCGHAVTRASATYDHVVPRVLGGKTRYENILISCRSCNQRKGGRTPDQAGMRPLSQPVRPKSLPEHLHVAFDWRPDYPEEWRAFFRDAIATHQYWNAALDED